VSAQPTPEVSIVVPSYRDHARLRACLASLRGQRTDVGFEVIVSISADAPVGLPDLNGDDHLHVITHVPRRLPAPARNAAVSVAAGEVLLFTDADVVVPPTWVDDFLAAWDGHRAVAGAVANGTLGNSAGTAEYLCEFLDFTPRCAPGPIWHGATCNLLVPRPLWERYGPFPELIGAEDTAFTHKLARDGLLVFAPSVIVEHCNRTAVRAVLAHQYQLGRHQAALARYGPHPWRGVLQRPLLAPAATLGRAALVAGRVPRRAPIPPRQTARVAPLVVGGLAAWGAGLAAEGWRQKQRRAQE
jgi:GT2 family glycosyltransferase